MSRVEGNDDQRIREMQEAQLRQVKDTEKRGQTERVSKSFNEVMSQRSGDEKRRIATKEEKKSSPAEAGRKDQKKVQDAAPQQARDNVRRADLARQALSTDVKARSEMSESARAKETVRTEETTARTVEERETVDREVLRDDLREFQRAEARHEEIRVDPDQPRDQERPRERDSHRGDGESDAKSAAQVGSVDRPKAAHVVRLPNELLAQLANSCQIALDKSGGTEVLISLKGTMLDGVTLRVSAKKGRVRAIFEGCDKQTKNLIESSRGELMRQLGKRGLELDILRAG